jgi:hypothetical protein
MKVVRPLGCLILLGLTGCTHVQLRRDTVRQAQTLADVYEQQVLNNVARFVYDPGALPDFAVPNAGGNGVMDSGNTMFSIGFKNTGFDSAGFGGGASRGLMESWTLTPVSDPRKLEWMRCAYQRAIAGCLPGHDCCDCPDCVKRWAEFYLGRVPVDSAGNALPDEQIAAEVQRETVRRGIVTSDCLNGPCWFHVGREKDVPKHCVRSAHYCSIFVWVCPGEGSEQLTKLTLTILDYAVHDPAKLLTKDVKLKYKDGTDDLEVDATVGIDENITAVVSELKGGRGRPKVGANADVRQFDFAPPTQMMHIHTQPELTPAPGSFFLPLQQSLHTLTPQ